MKRRYLMLTLITATAGIGGHGITPAAALPGKHATPTATEFARVVVDTTTAYAVAHHDPARITGVDCVEASWGRYMCSYAVIRPNRRRECHLMQATWTPSTASTYTVTLAGRVRRCGSLREALRSLP
jgi:hypothetical protein